MPFFLSPPLLPCAEREEKRIERKRESVSGLEVRGKENKRQRGMERRSQSGYIKTETSEK